MKFNQWTLGLAAVGVISLASAARAEESAVPLMTALSDTMISGYVDTSAHWNLGTGNANLPPYSFNNMNKADGFNLDVVQLSISKPMGAETEWAAGYQVDLWIGPDANQLGTVSDPYGYDDGDFAIRQAYVNLRAPVGNGLDFKVGVFDTIVGYESLEAGKNPNYTRSYGFTIEPQTHTGVLASYRFCEWFSMSAGIANTVGPVINERAFYVKAESYKTYMGSLAFTAPESWGFLAGSTLYGGVVNGYNDSWEGSITSWYAGTTVATPITGLKFGAAFDWLDVSSSSYGYHPEYTWAIAGYVSWQATEKLSLHGRVDYTEDRTDALVEGSSYDTAKIFALTGTIQYDLWENVISRLEVRWDHSANGEDLFGGEYEGYADATDAVLIAGNIIYSF